MAASHYGNATVTRSLLQHMAHLLTPTVSLDGKMPAIEAKGPVPETKARVGRLSRKGRGRKGEAPVCAEGEGGADGCGGVMQTEGVDGRDKNGETALYKACAEGRIETARVLLLEGAADWTIPVSPCAFS
jgi:ankyrin repeat protein